MTPAVIGMNLGMYGLLVPLGLSGLMIGYIYRRSNQAATWFANMHWRLAFRHSKWLMLGYAVTAALIFIAWLVSMSSHDVNMKHIILTALTRIAILPTLFAVMVTLILEASAHAMAGKNLVPEILVKRFPPPDNYTS